MKRISLIGLIIAGAFAVTGCSSEGDSLTGGKGPGDPNDPNNPADPNNPSDPTPTPTPTEQCKDLAVKYTGFGNTDLVAGRADELAGTNRERVKPYSALPNEYNRVLGATPGLINNAGGTYGEPPARWFAEPTANAVSLYSAYRVAFQGCLALTATDAKYAAAPSDAAAGTECAAMARKFWSRTPETTEIDACKTVAVTDSAKETDVRRRWAYACASVLTASGFLTY